MKKLSRCAKVFAVLSALSAASCLSFAQDRVSDLADTVTLTVGSAYGAVARIGPLHAGVEYKTRESEIGIRGGEFSVFRTRVVDVPAGSCGIGVPNILGVYSTDSQTSEIEQTNARMIMRHKQYGMDDFPATRFGAVGFSAGACLSFRFELNALEIIDFVLGIVGLDFMDDDMELKSWMRSKSGPVMRVTVASHLDRMSVINADEFPYSDCELKAITKDGNEQSLKFKTLPVGETVIVLSFYFGDLERYTLACSLPDGSTAVTAR